MNPMIDGFRLYAHGRHRVYDNPVQRPESDAYLRCQNIVGEDTRRCSKGDYGIMKIGRLNLKNRWSLVDIAGHEM